MAKKGTFPANAMRRGEIYWVDIPNAIGHELMKDRPAIIVSCDAYRLHKAGRQNACHQNLTALVPSARGKRRPRPGELQGGERLMTEPKDLCGRCAAMLQEGYDLKRVGGGVDHKVTCSHCGRRRYGATYTIEKHSKSKA